MGSHGPTLTVLTVLATGAALLVVPSAWSEAQADLAHAASARGVIFVQVTDTSINPLPAEVTLPALGLGVRLSDDGTALVVNVPDGLYLVEVRHHGHASDSRLLRVTSDTARIEFVLSPAADEHGHADALDAGAFARSRLRSFLGRSAMMTGGVFLTRTAIERRGARTVSVLLRGMANVRVERGARGRTIARSTEASGPACADGMLVFLDGTEVTLPDGSPPNAAAEHKSRAERRSQASWRLGVVGGSATGLPALQWVSPSSGGLVWIAHDPARASATVAAHGPRVTDIDRVRTSSVVAVEVYPSPGSVPPEFDVPGAECGAVLIWTTGA